MDLQYITGSGMKLAFLKSVIFSRATLSSPSMTFQLKTNFLKYYGLCFTTTGGMGNECLRYHSRLAELIAIKKGEQYAKTMSWIRSRISFALLRSALVCLRGSRTLRRMQRDIKNADIDIETAEGAIWEMRILFIYLLFFSFYQVDRF